MTSKPDMKKVYLLLSYFQGRQFRPKKSQVPFSRPHHKLFVGCVFSNTKFNSNTQQFHLTSPSIANKIVRNLNSIASWQLRNSTALIVIEFHRVIGAPNTTNKNEQAHTRLKLYTKANKKQTN